MNAECFKTNWYCTYFLHSSSSNYDFYSHRKEKKQKNHIKYTLLYRNDAVSASETDSNFGACV